MARKYGPHVQNETLPHYIPLPKLLFVFKECLLLPGLNVTLRNYPGMLELTGNLCILYILLAFHCFCFEQFSDMSDFPHSFV